MKQIRKLLCIAMILSASSFNNHLNAQFPNVDPKSISNNSSLVPLIFPSVTYATSTLTSINADMCGVDDPSTAPDPAATIGVMENEIFAVVYSGSSVAGREAGISMYETNGSNWGDAKIPFSSSLSSADVSYADVAVGVFDDDSGSPQYFALVVTCVAGEIYLDHFNFYPNNTYPDLPVAPEYGLVASYNPPNPVLYSYIYYTNNSIHLSSAGGTAKKPHIELWHTEGTPSNGAINYAVRYAIVWEQENVPTGTNEVWAVDGEITNGWNTYEPPMPNMSFKVDDGTAPDVVAVNANETGYPDRAYVTYLSDRFDELYLDSWDYNSQTMNNILASPVATVSGGVEFVKPRISGPMYYDYSLTSNTDDPEAVIVVTENDPSLAMTHVNTYKYNNTWTTPITTKVDASDYNTADGFRSNGYQAMYPVVTGIGEVIYNEYNVATKVAYEDYPTVFYSDYTYNAGINYPDGGDFFAFGIHRNETVTNPNLSGGSDYWEVNREDLEFAGPRSIVSPTEPLVAISTANNSGHDLLVTYFDGSWIRYFKTGSAATNLYDFKPGKTTSIASTTEESYHVYPNPVSTQLNITQADGADYYITDITGRGISNGTLSGSKASVSTGTYTPGVYIIHITKDGHTEKVKFVKQ